MPRIAAAVAVVVTVAVSIGINIARFPVVWEMVGSTEFSSESREAASATNLAESTSIADLSQVAPPESLVPPPVNPTNRTAASDLPPAGSYDQPGASTRFVSSRPSPLAEPSRTQPEAATVDAPKGSPPNAGDSASRLLASEARPNAFSASGVPSAQSSPAVGPSSDTRWPAELSPAMKYAANRPLATDTPEAKPSLTQRPLVPVVWPEGTSSPGQASVLPVSAQDKIERLPPVGDAKPSSNEDAGRTPAASIPTYPSTGR